MSNACSGCEYNKICNECTESDSLEVCDIKKRFKKLLKLKNKKKTERQKVIESGRY